MLDLRSIVRLGLCLCLVALAGPAAAESEVEREIAEVGDLVARAHFRTALSLVSSTRELLDAAPARSAERARLELLAATAEVALGRRNAARASLARALEADPDLQLDPAETSPKLVALWAEVRP